MFIQSGCRVAVHEKELGTQQTAAVGAEFDGGPRIRDRCNVRAYMDMYTVDGHAVGRRRSLFQLLALGVVPLSLPERAYLFSPGLHVQLAEVGVYHQPCLVLDRQYRVADSDQHRDLHRGRKDSDM